MVGSDIENGGSGEGCDWRTDIDTLGDCSGGVGENRAGGPARKTPVAASSASRGARWITSILVKIGILHSELQGSVEVARVLSSATAYFIVDSCQRTHMQRSA